MWETLIVGAGLAGLSTAYHLALRGVKKVCLVEGDRAAGLHASGKNAGMIRQTVSDPVLARLAREGAKALKEKSKGKGAWRGMYSAAGSILTAGSDRFAELESISKAAREEGIVTRFLSRERAAARVPLLAEARFERALHCPSDGLVDIRALLRGFLEQLAKRRIKIFFGRPLRGLSREKDGSFCVRAGNGRFRAANVVNAAGAWAGEVARNAGGTPVPLLAYRRHLYHAVRPEVFDGGRPFVWDLSHEFYFRPLKDALLLSPCDKDLFELSGRRARRAEETDRKIDRIFFGKARNFFGESSWKLKILKKEAALRTMTPDGRFVIGEDPECRGFFWAAGLGGHGVTTCFSAGRMAAEAVLGRPSDDRLATALSPSRFRRKEAHAAAR